MMIFTKSPFKVNLNVRFCSSLERATKGFHCDGLTTRGTHETQCGIIYRSVKIKLEQEPKM
jgi:hypothetical protein